MKKHNAFLTMLAMIAISTTLFGCTKDNSPPVSFAPSPSSSQAQTEASQSSLPDTAQNPANTSAPTSGEVVITFNYEKQSGYASNQFAVWIEDADGSLIKTLYATRYTANGGYKNRPDSIPVWVGKSDLASMTKPEIDAITGATPKTGTLSYIWDMTDIGSNTVTSGAYRFFVEGSLRWKNRVLYSSIIEVGSVPVTAQADAEFFFEAGDKQAALSGDSTETAMIGAVTARFTPAGVN